MARYLVETRRGAKGRGRTARSVAEASQGVTVVVASNPDRVSVEATHDAARRMAELNGEIVSVERDLLPPMAGGLGAPGRGTRTLQPRSSGAMVSRGGHVPWSHRG